MFVERNIKLRDQLNTEFGLKEDHTSIGEAASGESFYELEEIRSREPEIGV